MPEIIENQETEVKKVETNTQDEVKTAANEKEPSQAIADDTAGLKADIKVMKATIVDMKEKNEELFEEEIKNLEQKIKNAEDELSEKTTEVVTETGKEVTTWWDKHKADIFNYSKIAVLIYIAYRLTCKG